MIKGIYTAARSLNAGMKNMSTIANNLANINTTGYKRIVPFMEVMSKYEPGKMRQLTDYQAGEFEGTSNPLDLAIAGDSFFTVQTDTGIQFTKNGRFKISDEGFLVNESGDKVMGSGGAIDFSEFMLDKNPEILISKSGEIKVGDIVVDHLLISDIQDRQYLEHTGKSDLSLPHGSFNKADSRSYEVLQGFIEGSNVNPIKEMENMIKVSKNYESSQKMINYLDQSLALSKEIGRV